MLLHAFIKLHVRLLSVIVWCLTYWAWPTSFMLVKVSDIKIVSYLQKYFYLIRVLCVIIWTLSMNVLHTPIHCIHLFDQKRYISESVCSYWQKIYSCWFIYDMIIPEVWISGAELLNDFWISWWWWCDRSPGHKGMTKLWGGVGMNRSSSDPTWFQPQTGTNPALDSGCPARIHLSQTRQSRMPTTRDEWNE